MTDRSAVDTIRGYFYQFDLSILSILRLKSPEDSVEIECTEDVDIRTATDVTATQCKYYAKTEYNHSVIKDAVKHMVLRSITPLRVTMLLGRKSLTVESMLAF